MASSSIFLASPILPLILLHLLLATEPISSVRLPLTRVRSGKTRHKHTSTNTLNIDPSVSLTKSPLHAIRDVYTMTLAIGTPSVSFPAIMDTGSNLIWTKCGSNLYDTSKSSSFSMLDDTCEELGFPKCIMKYESGNSVSVSFGKETLTLGDQETIPNVTFACGVPNYGDLFGGIVGMGPGDLSLVSYLNKRVFAYCLGSRFDPTSSSVLLTESEASIQDSSLQTVGLGTDDSNYYISLVGISVGQTKLSLTKYDLPGGNGDVGRMVIDSGSTFTYLGTNTVDMISNELVYQTNLEMYTGANELYYDGLNHCFNSPGNVQLPNVVFHFEGADWELTRENYIYEKEGKDMACLAFIADDKKQAIFGNMQQQNMMVVYNLEQKSLSFGPATCG